MLGAGSWKELPAWARRAERGSAKSRALSESAAAEPRTRPDGLGATIFCPGLEYLVRLARAAKFASSEAGSSLTPSFRAVRRSAEEPLGSVTLPALFCCVGRDGSA